MIVIKVPKSSNRSIFLSNNMILISYDIRSDQPSKNTRKCDSDGESATHHIDHNFINFILQSVRRVCNGEKMENVEHKEMIWRMREKGISWGDISCRVQANLEVNYPDMPKLEIYLLKS